MPPLDRELLPRHVVIIPDGNRRWAKEQGMEPWEGHEAGAENIKELGERARELGIEELTLWGSSLENLSKRPPRETQALLDIYERYFKELASDEELHRNEVRVRVIGRWREQFPAELKSLITGLEAATADHSRQGLNFMLAYSGTDDMLSAVQRLVQEQAGRTIGESDLKGALMTAELPPVDFMIRTGGEPHLSAGFMMWEMADAELFFSEKLFPAFTPDDFEGALSDYVRRGRRRGQ